MTKFIVNGKQGYKTYHDWKAFWGMKGAPSTPPVPPGPDPTEPFYIRPLSENAVVSIRKNDNNAPIITIEYSMDGSTWQTLGTTSTTALTINVSAGNKVWLRASTNSWSASWSHDTICVDKNSAIGGNIMSLLYGSNFTGDEVSFPSNTSYIFASLFNDWGFNNKIVDASGLILPATKLTTYCYKGMFSNCASLTTAPTLPATTLEYGCYSNMFQNCSSLTTAPALPATTLTSYCYMNMFQGCTSLTTAPALPATTLTSYCYCGMFFNCYALTTAPVLPATVMAPYCYMSMFQGCYALTQAPILPATTLAEQCYEYMFFGCESLTTAPALPATTLTQGCYYGMFSGCYALTQAPILPATTLVSDCYTNMFQGCTSLNYIECLAVNDEDGYGDFRNYCGDWVDGVSYNGTFIASDNYSSGWYWGQSGVPEGWTVQTESGNPFEPSSEGGGGGTQIYQSNSLTVYDMGSEQGGQRIQANGTQMEVPDFYGNDSCFAMMKISADQGSWGDAYMTPHLGNGVTAYISNSVSDDGNCPFSYSDGDEYDYMYSLTGSDDGNQISVQIDDGYCRWVKFVKNQGTYEGNTPSINMDF